MRWATIAVYGRGMVAGYEVWIHDAGLELQEPVARTICPVEEHDGPCEVPWGFRVADEPGADEVDERGGSCAADERGGADGADERCRAGVLVLGLYASAEKAEEIVRRVTPVVGDRRVELRPGRPGAFDELRIQYEIENRS
jgi:hypothetical protein